MTWGGSTTSGRFPCNEILGPVSESTGPETETRFPDSTDDLLGLLGDKTTRTVGRVVGDPVGGR